MFSVRDYGMNYVHLTVNYSKGVERPHYGRPYQHCGRHVGPCQAQHSIEISPKKLFAGYMGSY